MQVLNGLFLFLQFILILALICVIYYDYNNHAFDSQSWIEFARDYFSHNEQKNRLLLGDFWFSVNQHSLQLIQPLIERYIAIWLWDPVFLFILQLPLAIILIIGALMVSVLKFLCRLSGLRNL